MTIGTYKLEILARELLAAEPTDDAPARALNTFLMELDAERAKYAGAIGKARKCADDELEVDEYPFLSVGGDNGVWVSAWIWVPDVEED